MARIRCQSCNEWINNYDTKCYSCGAVNEEYNRLIEGSPKTVEALKEWYHKELDGQITTKFQIGINSDEEFVEGIYKEGSTIVVYRNDTPSRTILYQGIDEAYAVNMMFFKIQEFLVKKRESNARAAVAVSHYKMKYGDDNTQQDNTDNSKAVIPFIFGAVVLAVIVLIIIF